MEFWHGIPGYEAYYEISTSGTVRSLRFEDCRQVMKQNIGSNGYYYLNISVKGISKRIWPHRTVAEIFVPNPEKKMEVNHKDGNKLNNHVLNLEWVTPSENIQHSYDTGLNWHRGESHKLSKLTEDDVRTIKVLLSIGEKQSAIATAFNISQQKISHINTGHSWSHINPFKA